MSCGIVKFQNKNWEYLKQNVKTECCDEKVIVFVLKFQLSLLVQL